MTEDVLLTADYALIRSQALSEIKDQLQRRNATYHLELEKLVSNVRLVQESKEYYTRAVDVLYEESVGEIEKLLNMALAAIFYDKVYKIRVILEDKRGAKSLSLLFVNESETPVVETDLKEGVGAGVRTVVSFVLHMFYLINKKALPVIFLDESYSQVSEAYVDKFFSFIQAFCKEKGLMLVVISHDTRFTPYADKVYFVSDGRVSVSDTKPEGE